MNFRMNLGFLTSHRKVTLGLWLIFKNSCFSIFFAFHYFPTPPCMFALRRSPSMTCQLCLQSFELNFPLLRPHFSLVYVANLNPCLFSRLEFMAPVRKTSPASWIHWEQHQTQTLCHFFSHILHSSGLVFIFLCYKILVDMPAPIEQCFLREGVLFCSSLFVSCLAYGEHFINI